MQVDKINSIQRQVLANTGAYRTTSTAAQQVLSGVEPADLVCELESALYKLKHSSSNVQYLGVDLEGFSMEKYIPTWIHPSSILPVQWDKHCPDFDLAVFTDGSKINGQVGAGFCIYDPNFSGDFQ
ncbi:hypothetical protein AVEN_68536-1 [Araneus ventricosus]|uniref:Uncharacterized protein n=1 Tax=Araneus ventricosus TaxID=182803 RepID=A0A4Y2HCS2_ARAVE|nr:hypothetical protein AVEN_68536-1 [Araneus ventricosus]